MSIETALVYIFAPGAARRFVGCGTLIEGPYIVTCRHVWVEAIRDGADTVDIDYPHARVTRPATAADLCCTDGEPEYDFVLLHANDIPSATFPLSLANHSRFETGNGSIRTINLTRPTAQNTINGTIDEAEPDPSGLRQFTGDNPASYWTDRGNSGSPAFIAGGQQLAGILSLSETGATPGKAATHEAYIVPATLIRRHLQRRAAEPLARASHIPRDQLQPLFDAMGAADIPLAEFPARLREYLAGIAAQAATPATRSNDGDDIDATLAAVRNRLAEFDPAGADGLLEAKIAEEEQARASRLLPLLRERARLKRNARDYQAALTDLGHIARLDPDDAWAWIDHGDLNRRTATLSAAMDSYCRAQSIARRLGSERDLSVSYNRIGDVKRAQGDLAGALAAYTEDKAIAARIAAADAANAQWRRDLAMSCMSVGDVKWSQGDLAGALASYTDAMTIHSRLAAADPTNAQWQSDLSFSQDKIGHVKRSQGDLAGALAAYTDAMAIRTRLAAADPGNANWQLDLSVSHDSIGSLKRSQGDLIGAIGAYTDAMAIRTCLAADYPSNAEWQHYLSDSYERIGAVKRSQSDLFGALAAYSDAMTIRARLAAADPANAEWQRGLSISHNDIGDMKRSQGDLAGALVAYTDAMTIRDHLAAADPANAEWQRDLFFSLIRLTALYIELDDRRTACATARRLDAQARLLADRFPQYPQLDFYHVAASQFLAAACGPTP